jgi:signal transduction histidine kinase
MSDVITEDIKPVVETEQVVVTDKAEQKPVEPTKKVKKPKVPREGDSRFWGTIKFIASSPWLLLTAALFAAIIWLCNNSWIITDNVNKPYALAAGPALAGSILMLWLVIKFFQGIISWCKSAWISFNNARKEDGSAQFFWIVIIVFMIVSVFASGTFFNTLEHNALPGLGYVTALFIDLVAVQAMRARLNAVRMRDKKGASLYLFGVLLCAGASAFANVYTSLADFNQHLTGALPLWMLEVGPWFGLIFPSLILLLSMTADYTLDQISTKLDPEQYKAQEAKRTKMLEYQRDALKERVTLEREVDKYTAQLQDKKEKRVFFLIAWLFPLKPLSMDLVVENVVTQMHGRIDGIVKDTYGSSFQMLLNQNLDLRQHVVTISSQMTAMDGQRDTDLSLVVQEINNAKGQAIDASISRIHQVKEDIVSSVMKEVLGRMDTGRDTDKLSAPIADNQVNNTPVDRSSDTLTNKEKRTPISKDPLPESSDTFDGLDEETKTVLRSYPFLLAAYSTGVRSLSISEIVKATGHTPQLVNARKRDSVFIQTRRKGFYSIASVMNWLKTERIPTPKDTTILAESIPSIPEEMEPDTHEVFEPITPRITGQLWTNNPDEILEDLGEMVIAE